MDEISGSGCLIGRRLSDGGASTPIARNFTKARLGPRAEQFDEFVVDEAGLEQS
jgi:hypothetical protein